MMAAFSLVICTIFLLPIINIAFAQYLPPSGNSSNIEEQLKLAKEKVSNANLVGAYGSGTSMSGNNIGNP